MEEWDELFNAFWLRDKISTRKKNRAVNTLAWRKTHSTTNESSDANHRWSLLYRRDVAAMPPPHIVHSTTPEGRHAAALSATFSRVQSDTLPSPSVGGGFPCAQRVERVSSFAGVGLRAHFLPPLYVRHIIELGAPWWPSSVL